MLKSLIFAVDAASPDYIFENKTLLPNLSRMMENGASGTYSSYVQKGYNGSYSSAAIWASIFTGLPPKEHKLERDATFWSPPEMQDYSGLWPLWQVLNENGLTVGLWIPGGCCLGIPSEIEGYVITSKREIVRTPQENREIPCIVMVCEKDRHLLRFLNGEPPPHIYPKTLKQYGIAFEELKNNPDLADKIANEKEFRPMVENFEDELSFWSDAMIKAQREVPIDVMCFYTSTLDVLGHFTSYCDNSPILIKAYKLLDSYVGRLIDELKPEITVFVSDHGQQNFKYLVECSDHATQREAFSASDNVVWLKNGFIAFEALNGGLLFTSHSLKGVFIANGSGIKCNEVNEMRLIDIYPTILEMLGVKVPYGRSGYVVNILDKPLINTEMLLKEKDIKYKEIALIQTHEVSVISIILNELYIENRFSRITVVGEVKYAEIFQNNPRVSNFVSFEHFEPSNYDEVYCGYYNDKNKHMNHIKIHGNKLMQQEIITNYRSPQ